MHPTLVREPFHRDGWVYEEKYDGWRLLVLKDGQHVRLVSRNGRDHTARFPAVTRAIARLPARSLILDGEICAFDAQLISHIYLLDAAPDESATPPVYMAFDCMYARGGDLRDRPLAYRLSWQEAGQGIRAERVVNVGCEHDRSQESRVERPR
jgi:bifunctional non-homologous end joining protein LigD